MDSIGGIGFGGPEFPDVNTGFEELKNQVNDIGVVHDRLQKRKDDLGIKVAELSKSVSDYTGKKLAIEEAESSKPGTKILKSAIETGLKTIKQEIEAIKNANSKLGSVEQATTVNTDVLNAWGPLNSLVSKENALFDMRKLENDAYVAKYVRLFAKAAGNRKLYNTAYASLKELHDKFVSDSQKRVEKEVDLIAAKITEFIKMFDTIKEKSDEVATLYKAVVDEDMAKISVSGGGDGDITLTFSPTFLVIVVVLILLLLILHFYFKHRSSKLKRVENDEEEDYNGQSWY